MDLPKSFFCDFLERYEYVNISVLEAGYQAMEVPYVVMAHIIGIVSTSAYGIDLIAKDHTGTTILALRGEVASHFYGEHLRNYGTLEPIVNPYALGGKWFQTYLFVLDWTAQVVVNGQTGHVVTQICMIKDIIDEFVLYKVDDEDYECFCDTIQHDVPLSTGYFNLCTDVGANMPGGAGMLGAIRRRTYARFNT